MTELIVHNALHNQILEYIANIFESTHTTASRNVREHSLKIPNCKLDVSHRGLAYKSDVL